MAHFIFIAPMHSYVTNVLVYNLHMTIFSRVYSYVTRMYSYVTCMLLVCTRVLLVCYSYVLVCYSYVTRIYYTTQAVRGPITKINQSKCSIAGPIFSKYWTGHCPEWSRTCVPLNLKLRWRTRTKSFENFVVKLQNGWLTLRNPVSALN